MCSLAPAILPRAARANSTEGPSHKWHKTTFWELHLDKVNSPQPGNHTNIVSLLRLAVFACFSPRPLLSTGPRRVWAATCSVGTGGFLLIAYRWNPLPTCSHTEAGWFGLKMPCVPSPQQSSFGKLRPSAPTDHRRSGTKLASGSCIWESSTPLREATTPLIFVSSGQQRLPVSHLGLSSPQGQGGSGLPLAPWPLWLCCCSLVLGTQFQRARLREQV